MSAPVANLKWTAQLSTATVDQSRKLVGDKILLPQSALEQLLSAATVTVIVDPEVPEDFDPFNPHTFASAQRSQVLERHQNLPHPLTFRLVNPDNGNVVYAGVREFSAEEDTIGLSTFLQSALGVSNERARVTIHAQQLPKGKHVRFRPLEAGYDPEDWKALLERQLRNAFTTLTKGEVLQIQSGSEEYRFLVDEVQPEGDGICIVDTDLEVDIEALNEEQARETLKKRLNKSSSRQESSSVGGLLEMGKSLTGRVAPGELVDYTIENWSSEDEIYVELENDGEIDVFVSFFSHLQREQPRPDTHQLYSVSASAKHTIRLRDASEAFLAAERTFVAVCGSGLAPASYSVVTTTQKTPSEDDGQAAPHDGETQCNNCKQWVPERTMILHENFCYRNNIACPKCGQVFKKQSTEWNEHWHCDEHPAYGSSQISREHHDTFFHSQVHCRSCGYSSKSMADLAHHRTTKCPEKIILCQFCHLLVQQQGPDDLDINDPEVIMSGLTPHELSDGSSTTECHICSKIIRLRDMPTHLRHHDMDRLIRPRPRLCRNAQCGNTLGFGDEAKVPNELGLCNTCFGPLYNSAFDPENKALKRRVERRYLSQMVTGCGKQWCNNANFCKTAAQNAGIESLSFKAASAVIKPMVEGIMGDMPLHFCVEEACQRRRNLAEMLASEADNDGFDLSWCIAALEAEKGVLDQARSWLRDRAPKRAEER